MMVRWVGGGGVRGKKGEGVEGGGVKNKGGEGGRRAGEGGVMSGRASDVGVTGTTMCQ